MWIISEFANIKLGSFAGVITHCASWLICSRKIPCWSVDFDKDCRRDWTRQSDQLGLHRRGTFTLLRLCMVLLRECKALTHAYRVNVPRLIFFQSDVLLSTSILILHSSYVSLPYLNLAVHVRQCSAEHSCKSSQFIIAILNGSCALHSTIS